MECTSKKKEQTTATHNDMDKLQKQCEWQKTDTEEHKLYDSVSVRFKNRQNQSMVTFRVVVISEKT